MVTQAPQAYRCGSWYGRTAVVGALLLAGTVSAARAEPEGGPATEERSAAEQPAPEPPAKQPAAAAPAAEAPPLPEAYLEHEPPSTAEAHEPLRFEATIIHPELVKHAYLVFRRPEEQSYRAVEFLRGAPGPYVAVVPEEKVAPPYLEYTIELELRDGTRLAIFGSRQSPHRIQVPRDVIDVVAETLDKRVDGRRNVFVGTGEYVSFGTSTAEIENANGQLETREVQDHYFRVEAGYTHRLLGWVSEFGILGGVVRGSAPVPVRDLQPGQSEDERFDVGLNYGSPWIRFRFSDNWHADVKALLSVNEIGFQLGGGSTLHIGDPYGTKLSIGFEGIQAFGMRIFTQVDIQAHERVRVAPVVEVTNAPSADRFGLRLLGELGVDIGYGFAVTGRGGYQARDFTSGGFTAGGTLGYAF